MKNPTKLNKKDARRMMWARKRVNLDGTTRDGFAWPVGVGGWVTEHGEADRKACGSGLHLGKTAAGLSSGGNLNEALMLACGYLPEDVLGEDAEKVRVSRCYVLAYHTGMALVLRNGWGIGANLDGASLDGASLYRANLNGASLDGASLYRANLDRANLYRANLDGADLDRASLYRANLDGANLDGANLDGANLYGASLYGARYDRYTRWPAGFDPTAAGAVQ